MDGKDLARIIAERKDRQKAARMEAQGSMFSEPSQIETGGFPACAKCKGITKAFHKPQFAGKRNSAGKLYDGHLWEPSK